VKLTNQAQVTEEFVYQRSDPFRIPTSLLGASKEAGSLSTLFPLYFLISSLAEAKSKPSQTSRGTPQAWVLIKRRLAT
jgi:hypothetical protein